MKEKNKKFIHIFLLAGILLMLFSGFAAALTHYDYSETFETDAAGNNPAATWYTYAEMGFDTAEVVADGRGSSVRSYRINDTDGGNINTDKSSFNFTSHNYSYFEFWFKWDNTSHNRSYGLIDSTNGYVLDIDFGMDAETLKVYNYTAVAVQRALTNNTWYRLRFDFNYSTFEVRTRLFNSAGTSLNDSWLRADAETGFTNFTDITSFILFASANDQMYIQYDDMSIHYSTAYTSTPLTQTNYIISSILPILFAVFVLTTFMGFALTGNLNRDTLILLMVIAIIGVVCLQVIASI